MISDRAKKGAVKAALTGAVFAVGTSLVFGNESIPIMGYQVAAAGPAFLIGAGASAISDVAHSYVNPELGTASAKLGDLSATALGVGIAAGSAALLASSLVGLPSENVLKFSALAGGSYLAADYAEMKFLEDSSGRTILW